MTSRQAGPVDPKPAQFAHPGQLLERPDKSLQYHDVPDLSDSRSLTASEGAGAEARLRAGLPRPEVAPECPEGATEATGPEVDPLPRGSDPEARALRPTLQGEGGTRTGGQR